MIIETLPKWNVVKILKSQNKVKNYFNSKPHENKNVTTRKCIGL